MRPNDVIPRVKAVARVLWSHLSALSQRPALVVEPEPPEREPVRSGTQELLVERLKIYEEEINRLKIENDHLRRSATAFGELAERLNHALRSTARGRTPIARGR